MPQEPKKRHSRARQGKRRASIRLVATHGITCPNCGANTLPHTVCKQCGFYKGLSVVHKAEKKQAQSETKSA